MVSFLFLFQISWSKIIALFAFAARLAQYCEQHELESLVFDVAVSLSQFAVERLTPFLRQNGGWVMRNIKHSCIEPYWHLTNE